MKIDNYQKYAPVVVRIALSFVFLWFGVNQLVNPVSFLGYVPDLIYNHGQGIQHDHPFQSVHNLPLTPHILIMGNGAFETVFGSLLLLGLFTRIASLVLALHLMGIIIGLGYNDVAIRDFGLALVTFSVFLYGYDKLSLDKKLKRKKNALSKLVG